MSESPQRTFMDREGVTWTVRRITPSRVERRVAGRRQAAVATPMGNAAIPQRRGPERRVSPQLRVHLAPEYSRGWLLLESSVGVRRRVAPVPPDWDRLSDAALELLARGATGERSAG